MKWIHLSDIHFNPNYENNRITKQLREKLISYIKDNEIKADEMFITGDFRNAAIECSDEQTLVDKTIKFIEDIANSVGVTDRTHIHIVPGNHDLERCTLNPDLDEIRNSYNCCEGAFPPEVYKQLISRFGFYTHIYNNLYSENDPITLGNLPLHLSKCYKDYALVYLNTAISCGNDNDRGALVIGNIELYEQLEYIKSQNPTLPIIVLAHHSSELFNPEEKDVIQNIFLDYNVLLYLCGDAHKISCRKINDVLEYTTGCMTYQSDVHITFACGELLNNNHEIKSYFWDSHTLQWGIYDQFNQHYKRISKKEQSLTFPALFSLDDAWFDEQNKTQIANLGQRYSPEVNVETNLAQDFNYVSKNNFFKNEFAKKSDAVIQNLHKAKNDKIKLLVQKLTDKITGLNLSIEAETEFNEVSSLAGELVEIIKHEISADNTNANYLRSICNELEMYIKYLNSNDLKLVNNPICILSGDGGVGKSHLIADTVTKRNVFHEKSILLLGQHFNNSDNPFEQMKKLLKIDCSVEEMLSQFNEIGKQQSTRLIIFIDAINEGVGITFWKKYLQEMIVKIQKYTCIGLVLSVRSHYINLLYRDTNIENMSIEIKHLGFALNGQEATKKYFEYYNINYNDVPLSTEDFQNPLFLRLFCETYKNQSINNKSITLSNVYLDYLKEINKRIAEKCMYDEFLNVVEETLMSIAKERHSKNNSSNVMSIKSIINIVFEIQNKYNIKLSLLDELLASGLLTKDIYDNDEEKIHITFERLEDFLYSEILVKSISEKDIKVFADDNKYILYRTDLLEYFSVLLSEKTEYEIFEVFPGKLPEIRNAFIGSLKWRQDSNITRRTFEFINNEVLKYKDSFELFVETLILLSTKKNHSLNAKRTVKYIMSFNMPDRDACFIYAFDKAFQGDSSVINVFLDWCFNIKNAVDIDTIKLAAKMIPVFFISSNKALRDKSTKALVSLLNNRTDILIEILDYYKDADDPYILERLYAVVFGCIVRERNKGKIKKLALKVYENVFSKKEVYPNILLRDYAKNTIDYAINVLGSLNIDISKTIPPYNSEFPVIPTDEEIKKYEIDYNSPDFKDYYWSQNSIISSMKVEYSRDGKPGGYGDFGRYVFQNYFKAWKQLGPNDLMNIAVKKVFDMGYDVEKHGEYDRAIKNYDRFHKNNERIGKKYQWIALYELAARVADNYKMEQYIDEHGKKIEAYCEGSFEPEIRNIDPTIKCLLFNKGLTYRPIHEELYDIDNMRNDNWITDFSDLPDINSLIHTKVKRDNFILLNGWYSWTEDKQLGFEKFELPQKDMWVNINSYIVKKEHLNEYISRLKGKNLMGRWLSEPNECSALFNREYYWSNASDNMKNPYYGVNEFVNITDRDSEFDDLEKVLLPTFIYYTERQGDVFEERNSSWYKPCDTIFNALNLKYGDQDTVLYDAKGKLICFDSQELLNENIGFYFEKETFFNFLHQNDYACFWTILSEKRVIGGRWDAQNEFGNIIKSGVIYIDQNNELVENINTFINE